MASRATLIVLFILMAVGQISVAHSQTALTANPELSRAFEGTCVASGANYQELGAQFAKLGWSDQTSAPPKQLTGLLRVFEAQRNSMPDGSGFDQQSIFVKNVSSGALYGWISLFHTPKGKGVSCQIYDFAGRAADITEAGLKSLQNIPPTRDEKFGALVLKWRNPSPYPNLISIKSTYVPTGSQLETLLGASGTSMGTTARQQE